MTVSASTTPPLFQQAASFAARQHRHQLRRDGKTPYIAHVFRVAMTVSQVFGCHDDTVLAAAILHDTIEDTTTDYEDIESRFGAEVAVLVAALTKNMSMPEEAREKDYDEKIARADWRARLIKLADTFDNYCDATTTPEQQHTLGDHYDKCVRAIVLARGDAAGHVESHRAIEAVERLISNHRRG